MKLGIIHLLAALLSVAIAPAAFGRPQVPPPSQLFVASQPAGAEVTLNGNACGVTPLTVTNLPPGDVLLILSKTGYETQRKTITLQAGARATTEVKLEPVRGLALVQTQPPGARISLDGSDRGPAPILLTDLPLGTYLLKAEAIGYLPRTVSLTLDSRLPRKVQIDMQSSTATLTVNSDPPGAGVAFDGVPRGLTPLALESVPSGAHAVELTLAGYAAQKLSITLEPGQSETISATLQPLPAKLRVITAPEKGRVYLDNQYRGIAPITVTDLPAGDYRLRVELPGHVTAARTVTLAQGEEREIEVRLENNSGSLELVTEPAAVTVLVDGVEAGITRFDTNATDRVSEPLIIPFITEGPHQIQLSRAGYFPATVPVEIKRGETLPLHQTLRRRFIPDYEITTDSGTTRGVLLERDRKGNIRMEVRPGVIKIIPVEDIKSGRPIQAEPAPDIILETPPK